MESEDTQYMHVNEYEYNVTIKLATRVFVWHREYVNSY